MSRIFSLAGRAALVTGASSGLGAHFARLLAGEGAAVALAARRAERIDALAAELRGSGAAAIAVAMDVTDPASVQRAVEQAERGLGRLDILVNNAGITASSRFLETSEEEWSAVLDTDLTGLMRVGQETARRMAARGEGGAILNVASILGVRPAPQVAAYAAAKAASISLTQSMALELARHRIRVNALAPGYIETDLNSAFLRSPAGEALARRVPMRRFGAAEDLDGAVLLLVSDAGRFITGATLPVDGGHLLSFV
ncbi:MAG: glucose 1-dehydrogenase [Alphaproteobacteria bacterium]|nr:glucose 1-dehydrogenase [Alphaproteobacteria bacterium]